MNRYALTSLRFLATLGVLGTLLGLRLVSTIPAKADVVVGYDAMVAGRWAFLAVFLLIALVFGWMALKEQRRTTHITYN